MKSLTYRGDWFKTLEYNLLHTGGFLRLCTDRGRVYWVAQNEHEHTTPDWKIHFSCKLKDVPRAWNILACLFMQYHCEIGMKATICTEEELESKHAERDEADKSWPARQRGRELTVYIFFHDKHYGNGPMDDIAPPNTSHLYHLSMEFEAAYDSAFWFDFIRAAERRFLEAGIESNGVADGDLALPGCRYASLRNEAFVKVPTERGTLEFQYPPNSSGWNGANHPNPLERTIACLNVAHEDIQFYSRFKQA
eukprot:TRINITY_DN5432_c0_g2_i5.p1 TRINITY_DN5432_c0_g2~~TRINITY_DN5432_c0_g2_i5.p1  ORF type:complete len:251 (+),score=22.46 TRINITY_DN5432_c0_g2_i5:69-821(+)